MAYSPPSPVNLFTEQSVWSLVLESRGFLETLPAIFQIQCLTQTLQIAMSKVGCQQITLTTLCSFQICTWLHSLYKDRQRAAHFNTNCIKVLSVLTITSSSFFQQMPVCNCQQFKLSMFDLSKLH